MSELSNLVLSKIVWTSPHTAGRIIWISCDPEATWQEYAEIVTTGGCGSDESHSVVASVSRVISLVRQPVGSKLFLRAPERPTNQLSLRL